MIMRICTAVRGVAVYFTVIMRMTPIMRVTVIMRMSADGMAVFMCVTVVRMPIVRVTILRGSVIVPDVKSDHWRDIVNMCRGGVNMLVMSMIVVVFMIVVMIMVVMMLVRVIVNVSMIMMSMRMRMTCASRHQTPKPLVEQGSPNRDDGEPRYRAQHWNDFLRDHILREKQRPEAQQEHADRVGEGHHRAQECRVFCGPA